MSPLDRLILSFLSACTSMMLYETSPVIYGKVVTLDQAFLIESDTNVSPEMQGWKWAHILHYVNFTCAYDTGISRFLGKLDKLLMEALRIQDSMFLACSRSKKKGVLREVEAICCYCFGIATNLCDLATEDTSCKPSRYALLGKLVKGTEFFSYLNTTPGDLLVPRRRHISFITLCILQKVEHQRAIAKRKIA